MALGSKTFTVTINPAACKRFCRYAAVGASGVGVNMFFFLLLRDYVQLGLTVSSVIAVEMAIVNNFIWNDIWTFRKVSKYQRGWTALLTRFYKFNSICLFGLVVNVLVVNILVRDLGVGERVALFLAIISVTVCNYILNMKFSWRHKELEISNSPLEV